MAMTEQLDNRVELGKAMWIAQADGFFNCVKANGIESAEDLAALFAGFMASATGAMIRSAGPQLAMSVLGAVSKSCAAQTVEQYVEKQDYKIEIAELSDNDRKERMSPKVTIFLPGAGPEK